MLEKKEDGSAPVTVEPSAVRADVPRDWFTRLFEDWFATGWFPEAWRVRPVEGLQPIRVERVVDGDAVTIKAEVPGIDPDDIAVEVTDHTLHISAERSEQKETPRGAGYQTEFRYGSYTRAVQLPLGAVEDKIAATYQNGILTISVPVSEAGEGTHRIKVQAA